MQVETTASIEDVITALTALHPGMGLTTMSLSDQPLLIGLLGASSAVDALLRFQNLAREIDNSPQVMAAKYGLGLPDFCEGELRDRRIKAAQTRVGISNRSFYRYEKIGVRIFAHELVKSAPIAARRHENIRTDDSGLYEDVSLESIYQMIVSLTESHQAIRDDVSLIKNDIDNLYQGSMQKGQPGRLKNRLFRASEEVATSDLKQLMEQIDKLSASVGSIHAAVIGQTPKES